MNSTTNDYTKSSMTRINKISTYLLNRPGATLPELRDAFGDLVSAQVLYSMRKAGVITQKGKPHCYEYYANCSAKLKI